MRIAIKYVFVTYLRYKQKEKRNLQKQAFYKETKSSLPSVFLTLHPMLEEHCIFEFVRGKLCCKIWFCG